ncbi:MAG: arginyltransferase [SAR324 cluster bacterium]|uniref:Aspartate/glutamate leucyltransferase n=1 Tax=SAR324 cluster bacterium TaxID=2024889 RepID=A0A2A4SV03_9DELT|nr:MAG: arginyltransferase [SAR324 cluster bacterium]
MEVRLFEASNGACPYLENHEWYCYLFRAGQLEGGVYEALISNGFRRNGDFFYKNSCRNCKQCISLRIPVNQFLPSRSQKRVWRKNQDLRITHAPVTFDEESYNLYQSYSQNRHQSTTTREEYCQFLIHSAVETIMMRYYLADKLVGVGWLDLLPDSISSVYFAFDPELLTRSLGVFSIMKEIEFCREHQKSYLHLGFWVKENQAMKYKSNYQPHQLLNNNEWVGPD